MKVTKITYSKKENEIVLIEQSGKENSKTVLIIGTVHGDEPQGKFLIENYIKMPLSPKNRMLFIPCLNPDGFELKTRQNANEIDINRNFSTKNWVREPFASEYFGGETSSSEIETKFVEAVLEEFTPDVILTLHAPFKVVNYDGPASEIAQKISEIINYPVQSDIGYSTPGSFGTYAGIERNIPTITLEVDEEIEVKELIIPMNKIFDYLAFI
jgi:murein peptide amidase A